MAALQLRQLVKRFGDQTIIHGIDLDIADGELIVFVGPSGCGKSTLLRMIAGLEDISDGTLTIDGKIANTIAPAKRGVAMVFQSYALYPHVTVFENMAFGLRMAGKKPAQVEMAVQHVAQVLQIVPLLRRKPAALSGGQRQRVAIGRAIVREPAVFLFDEPLSNLDATLRCQMRIELGQLHRRLQTTMIYVTHDQLEAMTLGQRIAVFNGGRIEQVGTPQMLYEQPRNLFVARFLGAPAMNLVPATITALSAESMTVHLAGGLLIDYPVAPKPSSQVAIGDAVTVGIRPEYFRFCTEPSGLAARVEQVEYLGGAAIVHVRLPGCENLLTVRHDSDVAAMPPGAACRLTVDAQRCHVFDRAGRALRQAPLHSKK